MNRYSSVLPSRSDAFTVYDIPANKRADAEVKMLPGDLSPGGFIGVNDSLLSVCEKDLDTLLRLKVSCDNISDALENLVEGAKEVTKKSLADVARVGKFLVIGSNFRSSGTLVCPFTTNDKPCHTAEIPADSEEGMITIKNTESNKEFSFSPILIPMVRFHALFYGNVPNRVDPGLICETLELVPDADLHKARVEEKIWKYQNRYEITQTNSSLVQKHMDVTLIIDDLATAYLGLPSEDPKDSDWEIDPVSSPPDKSSSSAAIDDDDFCIVNTSADKSLVKKTEKTNEKLYCHIFNHQTRKEEQNVEIAGVGLDRAIVDKGIHVYQLYRYSVARIVDTN